MTLSTPTPAGTAARSAARELTDIPRRMQPVTTGWYDPDGAAWEGDSPGDFEAFRATVTRPSIIVDTADATDR